MRNRSLISKIRQKVLWKKVRCKRKNYMYLHIDEVQIQKIYEPDWPFYIRLLFVPSIAVILLMILTIFNCLDTLISSIIIGVLGSFIASVIVTWLVDISNCKSKTMERMRFQHVYFSNLLEICGIFIHYQVLSVAKEYPEECKAELANGEGYRYFKGYPWQYWFSLFNDIVMTHHPFSVTTDNGISDEWITETSKKYDGKEFEKAKPELEDLAKRIFENFFNNSDLLERIMITVQEYRSSLPAVYVNDNIYKLQLTILNTLLDSMERLVNCVKGHDFIDLWNSNFSVLKLINALTTELYPFRIFRENECVHHVIFEENNEVRITYEFLESYVDDNNEPVYSSIRRSEYRKVKKQIKINDTFNNENNFIINNGWRTFVS